MNWAFNPAWSMRLPAPGGLAGFPEGRQLVEECFQRLWAKQDIHHLTIVVRETETYKALAGDVVKQAMLDAAGPDIHLFRHAAISLPREAS